MINVDHNVVSTDKPWLLQINLGYQEEHDEQYEITLP